MTEACEVKKAEDLSSIFAAIAAVRGEDSFGVIPFSETDITPISSAVIADQARAKAEAERFIVGKTMEDGTIYLGNFGEKDWFVAAKNINNAADAFDIWATFDEAVEYAKNLNAHGHHDWMLPPGSGDDDGNILLELFLARNIGDFAKSITNYSPHQNEWYWSGASRQGLRKRDEHYQICMTGPLTGTMEWIEENYNCVRCVRAVPRNNMNKV